MRNAVIVFGATSFVGRILCRYLLERHGVGGELRWAAAGRSLARLEELRAALGPAAAGLPLLVADAGDEVRRSVRSSRWNICVLTLPPTKPARSDSGFSSPYVLT